MVMDALRYWVEVMHVDGFRFDLAATLTRDSAFLAAKRQDPVLQRVKLIAEPWDIGPDGYRLGRFLPGWSEWNDRFRDDVRAFWLTGGVGVAALAQRLAGSSEVFRFAGRAPQAGVNFITAHDGFTLRDWSAIRRSTTSSTARVIATGTATTSPGTAGRRARAAIRSYSKGGAACSARC
jgi:isoamylase